MIAADERARAACAALPTEHAPCPLCGGDDHTQVAAADRYGLDVRTVACVCGHVFTNPRPTAAALQELQRTWLRQLYGHETTPTRAGAARRGLERRAATTLGVLLRFGLGRARSLLEVDCGYGCVLQAAGSVNPGLRRAGVEADPAHARFVRDEARCPVVGGVDELAADDRFDVIVLVQSLEHAPDPVGLLRSLVGRLAPGGALYLDVPDARRYSSIRDLHYHRLQHFTTETLAQAATKAGLVPVLLETHDPPANVPSIHGVFQAGGPGDVRTIVARIDERRRLEPAQPREFFSWFAAQAWTKPWLVLGKGPTFSRRSEVDLTGFHLFGLNHVCRQEPVEVAHAIDLDVVEQLGDALLDRAKVLVMPWRPHVGCKATELTLGDAVARLPVLQRLAEQGRLFWYNLSTAQDRRSGSPMVHVAFFSGEAAVRLLAIAGVRTIRTLGIDGGTQYSGEFADLEPLTNGVESFDAQALAIAMTVRDFNVDFAPLCSAQGAS